MIRLFGRPPPLPHFGALAPRHAEACAALHAGAFAHGWPAIEFERLIAARSSWADAAFDGRSGALVGFVLSRATPPEAEVLTIVVSDELRRRGIGRGLLERHVRQLADGRVNALFLEVGEDNVAARTLYAFLGFEEVGRRAAYYRADAGGAAKTALVLRRAIV